MGNSCGWELFEMLILIFICTRPKLLCLWYGWLNRSSAGEDMINAIMYSLVQLSLFLHLWLIWYFNWNNIYLGRIVYLNFFTIYTPWSMIRFGGGCHINLYHQSISNYVEDGTPKIHFIHLKDILEESINYNLSANKSDLIAEGRVSQIKPYWVLRVKFCLFFDNMEAKHSLVTKE